MTDLLFDTPWWLLGLLLIAGIALFVAGNNRQDRTLKRSSLGVLGLAILLAALSFFIDTDREKVIKRTRQLVQAVEKKDSATFASLLHPRASLFNMDKEELVSVASKAADNYHLTSINIGGLEAKTAPDGIVATFSAGAAVDSGAGAGNVPTTWEILWIKTPEGWMAKDFHGSIQFANLDLNSVLARFRK